MDPVSLIIVSDIHAGAENLYTELRTATTPAKVRSTHLTRPALVAAIEQVVAATPAARRVLICSGDLTDICHSKELQLSASFLNEISNDLSIPSDHRFLIPGNHEIDWLMTKQEDNWYDEIRQQKFEHLVSKHAPLFKFVSRGQAKTFVLSSLGIQIFLLDSPFLDRSTVSPHHGRLGDAQIIALDQLLGTAVPGHEKIVVLHHHITALGRAHDQPDFSILLDAHELIKVLKRHNVRFVIHGHQHRPVIDEMGGTLMPLTIVAAGSTTASFDALARDVWNAFHVLTFEDLTSSRARGTIDTRIFILSGGWQFPIYETHGIAPRYPFGLSINQTDLENWADEAIILCKSKGIIKLEKFLATKADGQYLPVQRFREAVMFRLTLRTDHAEFEWQIDSTKPSYQLQYNP